MKEKEYDFFISHASEDKELFVRPLVKNLLMKGYKVWYDEMSLRVGDSIVENISNGIKKSIYGIIILSKNFFEKKWTKKELEALLNKEIITGKSSILPIWLNLTTEEVYNFSPLLVDKLAISVQSHEIDTAITMLEKKFSLESTTKGMIRKKVEFLLDCNEDERKKYFFRLEQRIKSIFLYQEAYYNWYTSEETFNDKNPWDDILVATKEYEFRKEYGVPQGVWTNPEPFSANEIERGIKLCSKWVFRELNYNEAQELYYLLEEVLDTDVHYILFEYPHSSVKDGEVYEEALKGIFEVGIKNPAKRVGRKADYENALKKIFDRYYR